MIQRVTALAMLLMVAGISIAQDTGRTFSYRKDIQPILEKNCVVCHACYDAPCQLKLESPEGLERGASKAPVYAPGLKTRETTRLFTDAQSTEEWRRKGFFSVIEGGPSSLLGRMLELGKKNEKKSNEPVPAEVKMGLARTNECPTRKEFDAYAHRHMHEGMPFGMAPLAPGEYETLQAWLAAGAPIDGGVDQDRSAAASTIAAWEAWLNGTSEKDRLAARYVYEHLFIAHLYLDRQASSGFFEMVRSTTPPGQPIVVVPTRRPTDNPGDEFYYRLRPLKSSIVEKTHITYYLGADKLARVKSLFASQKWTVDEQPPYQRNGSLNPFEIFAAIPPKIRYQFMLDDAQFYVQSFIRGPVCLGQIATDVIEDHFATFFQTPESDLFCTDPEYAETQMHDIDLGGRDGFSVDVVPKWMRAQMNYANRRAEKYHNGAGTHFSEIWRGNNDAVLTIFRNFDSSTVIRGLRGRTPKTLWVMDYPIFERIYYLLVANFDVFGSATHQVGTRLYFDLLRAESEVNFLRFLPKAARKPTLASWYKGTTFNLKTRLVYPVADDQTETQVTLGGGDPKEEFVKLVRREMGAIAGPEGDLSGMCSPAQDAPFASAESARAEAVLGRLGEGTGATNPWLKNLPESTFVRVEVDGGAGDLAYTLNRVKWHSNVASMLRENARLDPDQDYVTFLRGPVGCYPNFIFHVKMGQLEEFTQALSSAASPAEFTAVVNRWGVRRTHPMFWNDFQFFREYHARRDPVEAGIFDANRYENF